MEALKGIAREKLGTRETRRLRRAGKTPGIIYGHGGENISFAVETHDLNLLLKHGERLVRMEIGGDEDNYLVKALQRDGYDNEIIHVDFTRVNLDEKVELTVPITLKGTPVGEAAGGVLSPGVTALTISCLVTQIPEEIVVRVNDMVVGDVLRVQDLPAVEGSDVLTDAQAIIATCRLMAEETEDEEVEGEGEEGSEPEVIGKGKGEDEESEGQE